MATPQPQKLSLKLKKDKSSKRVKPYPTQEPAFVVEAPIQVPPDTPSLSEEDMQSLFGTTSDISEEEQTPDGLTVVNTPKCPIHEGDLTVVNSKDGNTIYLKCEDKCGFFSSLEQLFEYSVEIAAQIKQCYITEYPVCGCDQPPSLCLTKEDSKRYQKRGYFKCNECGFFNWIDLPLNKKNEAIQQASKERQKDREQKLQKKASFLQSQKQFCIQQNLPCN